MNRFIVGRNPVMEALRAGTSIETILLSTSVRGRFAADLRREARRHGVVVKAVPPDYLRRQVGTGTHQGVVAVASAWSYVPLEEILRRAKAADTPALVVILQGVQDPQNLGSIIRTAEALGVHGIVIPKRRAVGVTPTVTKASAGAAEHLPIAVVTNVARTLSYLKEAGLWIVGAEAGTGTLTWEVDLTVPLAVVLGSEGKGISRLVRETCDFLVEIPMGGKLNSLNVSVAAGIMLYEVMRQKRSLGHGHWRP